MKNIDFLPNRYREQSSLRKGQVWRVAALVLFGSVMLAVALGQYFLHQAGRRQLAAVAQQHADAQTKTEQFAQLQQQLEEVRSGAQLYAYLHHPWPRTQILSVLAEKLPASLTLTELRISREMSYADGGDARRARAAQPRDASSEEADSKLPAAVRDLARLRDENDAARTLVELSGLTPDIASLYTYIGQLSETPLFVKCELASHEAVGDDKSVGQSKFQLRIVVRPGYGQPGSPGPYSEVVAAAPAGGPGEARPQ